VVLGFALHELRHLLGADPTFLRNGPAIIKRLSSKPGRFSTELTFDDVSGAIHGRMKAGGSFSR
jgi:hypothetical protein